MEFNYIIQKKVKDNYAFLCSMREFLLKESYAPLNCDLFYDQFFDEEKLSKTVKRKINAAKLEWINSSESLTVSLDYGLDSDMIETILYFEKNFPNKKINYTLLHAKQSHLSVIQDIVTCDDAVDFFNKNSFLVGLNGYRIYSIIKNAKKILPNHLPDKFSTFDCYYKSSSFENDIPTKCLVESPFAGDILSNVDYASKVTVELLLSHNKAPILSHVLYTHVLNDYNEDERRIGIDAGLSIGKYAEESIVCIDRGLSSGMEYAINSSIKNSRPFYCFTLSKDLKIKEEVKNLKTLEEIKEWERKNKEINKDHYNQTGYIIKI